MSLFTHLVKKSINEFLGKHKKWIIGFFIFIGLLIGLNVLINHYSDKVVGDLIREFVHEKSNGFYKVDFDEIAYLLNDGRFFVTDFRFDIHPNYKNNINFVTLDQNYIYQASIPKLHIDIIDFWSIIINRKLKLVGVEIESPVIKILNLNKNKAPIKISFEARNLYEVLSGQLNELRINDFLISEGEFYYETYNGPDYDNFSVKGVTFQIRNLKVSESESMREDKFFYTDDISLQVTDQVLFLKDSIHKVTFDKFYFSTANNEIGFENFNLTQREDSLSIKKDRNHYEISLPTFRLAGIDFVGVYNKNLLKIDSILIDDPTINIKKRTHLNKVKGDTTGFNLVDIAMINNYYLDIDHFILNEANLIFTDESKQQPKTYNIDHISAYLSNVVLDTGKTSKHAYGFDFDEVELLVKDYEVTLPDSVNTVKFSEFSITSSHFQAHLKDLKIRPDEFDVSSERKSHIYANIPYLVLSEFDVTKAINLDTFIIQELYLENPEISIIPAPHKNKVDTKMSPAGMFGIYKSIQSFSDLFVLYKLKILNGKLDFESSTNSPKNQFALNQIDFEMENFIVDKLSNTEDDLFGKAELNLILKNSSANLPTAKIDVGNFFYTTNNGRMKIDDLSVELDNTKPKQKVNITSPELLITDINPNEILFENIISLDTVNFYETHVLVDVDGTTNTAKIQTEEVSLLLPVTTINHLIGTNYKVVYREDGLPVFSAEDVDFNITKLHIDQSLSDNPINQFDYEKIDLFSIDNYDLILRDQKHLLEVDHISWVNKTSTFSIDNIALQPFRSPENRYDISIPSITMTGINLKKILKESHYVGDEIVIEKPNINLKLAKGESKKISSLDLGFIPVFLRNKYFGVTANTFALKDASINFHQKIENDSLIFEVESLNLTVEDFDVDSSTTIIEERFRLLTISG